MLVNRFLLTIAFIVGCICFCTYTVSSQEINKVKIIVFDKHTNSPLPQCIIKDKGQNNRGWTTDTNGVAYIPDRTTVEIRYIGYISQVLYINSGKKVIKIFLTEDSHRLKEVSITQSRTIRNTTSSVGLLDRQLLEKAQNESMAKLLSSIGGCRVLSTGAMIEKPIVDGMSGSRIAIVDNNSKIVGQNWGDDHAPEIDIPSYASVSVIKGAESVKYGASAIGGVVIVNTDLNPQEKDTHFGVQYSLSSNGLMNGGSAFLENDVKSLGNFRYRIGYKYYRSFDYTTPKYRLSNTGSWISNLRADLSYNINKLTIHSHFTHYNTEIGIYRGAIIGSLDDLMARYRLGSPPISSIPDFTTKIEYPKQNVSHSLWNTQLIYNIDDKNKLDLRYTLQSDYRREYSLRLGDFVNVPGFAFTLLTNSLSASYKHFFSDRINIELGASATNVTNTTDDNTGEVPIIPNYVTNDIGLFFLSNFNISNQSVIQAGIRYDNKYTNSLGFDNLGNRYGGVKWYNSISGTLGSRYTFNEHNKANINIALAWRAPDMNELYSSGLHHGEAVYKVGDSNLKTEKAIKLTSGYTLSINIFKLQANLFGQYIYDYIYETPKTTKINGVIEPIGIQLNSGYFVKYFHSQDNALFFGGDFTANISILNGLEYTLRAEFIRGYNTTAKGYFPYIPSDRIEQILQYSASIKNINISLGVNHTIVTKQTHFDNNSYLLPDTPPAYNLLGASFSAAYTFRNDSSLELYIKGYNITNNLYKEYTNRLHYFMHEKGIDITTGIRYNF